MNDDRFEHLVTPVPGPRSLALQALLERYESRGVTYLSPRYPVFWKSAHGATVTDVDDNRYLDLTSAFGVANIGHTSAAVTAAITEQATRLIHGMGDVHPTEVRARLLETLARITPGALQKTYLSAGGAEAIEFARKTAFLATGKPRILAYTGAYHGLSLGTLDVIGIPKFRDPFAPLLDARTTFVPYPNADDVACETALDEARRALDADTEIGAILLEPVQGRGGVIVPLDGFLCGLRALCDERGVLLILDEIYTGFGRTGTLFACERENVVPDLLCIGKAIAGGVPLAATIGTARVMDAWAKNDGEALHTATFLGNPLACAAALATIDTIERLNLVANVQRRAPALEACVRRFATHTAVRAVRGIGFLWALEFADAAIANQIVVAALARGLILLQSGPTGTSVTIAPPLTIDDEQLARALAIVERTIKHNL
jgi:4-aminobutyrate aminotransferase-like enzyme